MGATAGTAKFLNETVEVLIHDVRMRPRLVRVAVNGRAWAIRPNQATQVPRLVVDALCRVTRPVMRRRKFPKKGGAYGFRQVPTGGVKLLHPFSILRDDNPRGADWLKAIIGQLNGSRPSASSKPEVSRNARM